MKKLLVTAVLISMAGVSFAADFADLQTLSVPLPAPVRVKAAGGLQLSIPAMVESVGVTEVNIKDEFFTLRYILERYDIYPQLRVEVFQKGGEGAPTLVNSVMEVYPGPAGLAGDSQITDVKWAGYTLKFKLNEKNCAYDLAGYFLKPYIATSPSLSYTCAAK